MSFKCLLVLVSITLSVGAQRSPYAGLRPIGYPAMEVETTTPTDALGDRVGSEEKVSSTTVKLPLEALGDQGLVDRLSKLPVDQQPFWFINWQALESFRKRPQTYEHRPNNFIGRFV